MSTFPTASYEKDSLPGVLLKDDVLYLSPDVWTTRQDYSIPGISGVVHRVDFLAESMDGHRIIGIRCESTEESIYRAIGMVHMASVDLDADFIFVISRCEDYEGSLLNALKLTKSPIVSSIRVGEKVYTADSGKNSTKKSSTTVKQVSVMRTRRDRMRIMIDVMEFLDSQSSRITNLVYKCNLNYKTASELLDDLIKKKYVELRQDSGRESSYVLTKSGREALQNARKLYSA